MAEPTRFVGLDVHKDTIVIAVAEAGAPGGVTAYGTIPNTTAAVEAMVRRLGYRRGTRLAFSYEAGPCGYGLHRALTEIGQFCLVAAPSLIPRRSGERRKSDRRDAAALASLHRGDC